MYLIETEAGHVINFSAFAVLRPAKTIGGGWQVMACADEGGLRYHVSREVPSVLTAQKLIDDIVTTWRHGGVADVGELLRKPLPPLLTEEQRQVLDDIAAAKMLNLPISPERLQELWLRGGGFPVGDATVVKEPLRLAPRDAEGFIDVNDALPPMTMTSDGKSLHLSEEVEVKLYSGRTRLAYMRSHWLTVEDNTTIGEETMIRPDTTKDGVMAWRPVVGDDT